MQKLKMKTTNSLTFEEGCNKYLEYCRQRNLREGTINHYKQSYKQFYKFFKPDLPVEKIDAKIYKDYVLHFMSSTPQKQPLLHEWAQILREWDDRAIDTGIYYGYDYGILIYPGGKEH